MILFGVCGVMLLVVILSLSCHDVSSCVDLLALIQHAVNAECLESKAHIQASS